MPEEHHNNPYDSPQNTQYEAVTARLHEVKPQRIVYFAIAFGFVVGAVSSYVRPMISGPVHYEAIVSLLLLVLFFVITLFICLGQERPVKWTSVIIVVTWITYFAGWSLVAQRIWGDLVGVSVAGAGCSLAAAVPLVILLRWLQNRKESA